MMIESIGAASTAMQQSSLAGEVSASMLKSSLDAAEVQGEAVAKMIDSAAPSAAAAPASSVITDSAVGTRIDVTA